MTKIKDCTLLSFPKIADERGNLSVIEQSSDFPFSVKRVFYLYEVPNGMKRGIHALKKSEEVLIALSGSLEVLLDDGINKKSIILNQPNVGLYIPHGIWRELYNFSSKSIILVLASEPFSKDDYIWDYDLFKKQSTL